MHYILDGHEPKEEPDALKWALWLQDADRTVGNTRIESVVIRTDFMGLDYRHFGQGDPLLFETMVFGGPMDGQQMRYTSWAEAEMGHKKMVKLVEHAQAKG